MRGTRLAVSLTALVLVLGPLTLPSRGATPACPNIVPNKAWLTVAAPRFEKGPAGITAYAVHPHIPSKMIVTNGKEIWLSSDMGCSWGRLFSLELLPDLTRQPLSEANATIKHLAYPQALGAPSMMFVTLEEAVGPVVRPRVLLLAEDGSLRWDALGDGLPLTSGGIYGIHPHPRSPGLVYLFLRSSPADITGDVYASTDGGRTWQERGGGTATTKLAIDPGDPETLWAYSPELHRSFDGGRTWAAVNSVGAPTPILDVFHEPGAPARIMAYEAETFSIAVSRDGGASWRSHIGPTQVALSMAHGADPDDVVLSVHDRQWRFEAPNSWIEITPFLPGDAAHRQLRDLHDLTSDLTAKPNIYGRTPDSIVIYTGLDDEIELPGFDPLDPPGIDTSTSLQPAETRLKLEVGASREQSYTFDVPAHPTPLDVFFLVDTTASMDASINGLRRGMQNIVTALGESKIDAQFGVGEIKDYPVPGYGDRLQDDVPYRLLRGIGPADAALQGALESLRASGGGIGDYRESQLTGLYQAATGTGEPGFVPAGQDAGFRPEALKVIVNITDYGFHDEIAHPSPSSQQVINELKAEGIKQVGLAVWGSGAGQGMELAAQDMGEIAAATGTVAPPGGVDCEGDGATEVSEGQPLVCRIREEKTAGVLNLAPAIIGTLKALTENVEVELLAQDDVVDVVTPGIYPAVDITESNTLGFDVRFTCLRALAGETRNVTLVARVQEVAVATAEATIRCATLPPAAKVKPQPKSPPPVPEPLLVPQPAPVQVAVPIAIAPAAPPTVPQTINAPQSAQAAQGAMAPQEQEQVEVAVAVAQFKNDEALAFSAMNERTSPIPLYAAASVLTLAAGWVAAANRRRGAAATARRRR